MLAYRRRRMAVALLIVGWAISARVAPAFVSFARDRMHYGCFWQSPNGWWCPPDAIPFEILVATQVGLGAVFGLALIVVIVFVGHPRGTWGAVALLVLALLPAGYALLSLALAAVGLDPAGSAAQRLGDLWWVAVGPTAVVIGCAAAAMLLAAILPGRPARIAAAVLACAAWLAIPLAERGLAWLTPLSVALVLAALLTAPLAESASQKYAPALAA
jgi:hypothetical protein